MKPLHKALIYTGVLVVLGLVFALYTRPDFMMTLANQVWGCF
jgi:hypothetical protein